MLGTDFIKYFGNKFDIIALDRGNGDITNMEIIESLIKNANLDLILNFAAYTDVENAENTGRKDNFDVNTL
jgi:dTDP-4-dehydrorhamnose reductase